MAASRQDQARITVTVDGRPIGVWDERTGGDADSSVTQYAIGGMGPRLSLGGRPEVANVIVRKLFDLDVQAVSKFLVQRASKGVVVVTEQPLDTEGTALGDPYTWNGTLKRCKLPERNSDAQGPALIELEVAVSGPIV